MAGAQITGFELSVLSCVSATLGKFSDQELALARSHNRGVAAIDPMSLRFAVNHEVARLKDYVSPLRLMDADEVLARDRPDGLLSDLGAVYRELITAVRVDLDRHLASGQPWLGINCQLTREQCISVSNASMALHLLGRRGPAFTVSQLGVISPYKAWQVADLWQRHQPLNVLMTAGDRWVGMYDPANHMGRHFADGAAVGCFQIRPSNAPNFWVGVMKPEGMEPTCAATSLASDQVSACVSLVDSMLSHQNLSGKKLHFFPPPSENPGLTDIHRGLMQMGSSRGDVHDAPEGHRGSAQWLRSLERFRAAHASDASCVAVMWDWEPGSCFGATVFAPVAIELKD